MTKYLRKNQKKVLAIFSVGLMIAFALPSMTSNSRRGEQVVGTIDGGKVTIGSGEYNVYRSHWQALKRQFGPQALSVVLAGVDRGGEAVPGAALGGPAGAEQNPKVQ